jgi:hypothetical protein
LSPPWHVFVSYKRRGHTEQWLDTHFLPRLEPRLSDALAVDPRVFVDRRALAAGARWKTEIGAALAQTPLMILLLNRRYLVSSWCKAELTVALARSRQAKAAGCPVDPVIALQLQDGEHNPEDLRAVQIADWRTWNVAERVFETAPAYVPFSQAMADLADDIARRLDVLSSFPLPAVPLPEVFDDVDDAATGPLPRIQP